MFTLISRLWITKNKILSLETLCFQHNVFFVEISNEMHLNIKSLTDVFFFLKNATFSLILMTNKQLPLLKFLQLKRTNLVNNSSSINHTTITRSKSIELKFIILNIIRKHLIRFLVIT